MLCGSIEIIVTQEFFEIYQLFINTKIFREKSLKTKFKWKK
jgi:hypothetical protein